MTFNLLQSIEIADGSVTRRIGPYEGQLTDVPPEHRADILIISAFPNDYSPSLTSLIGALHRKGLSVRELASAKAHDLRETSAFWISAPIKGPATALNFGRIACFEPQVLGSPPTVVGNLFRGLFPFLDDRKSQVVAMPLLATGDQGFPPETMLRSILDAAVHWLARGLPIAELKIVEWDFGPRHALGRSDGRFQIKAFTAAIGGSGDAELRCLPEFFQPRWRRCRRRKKHTGQGKCAKEDFRLSASDRQRQELAR